MPREIRLKMQTILKRFRAGTSTVQHWKNLYDTLYFLITVGRILHENNVKLELLEDIGKVFTEDLAEVAVILGTVIDFSESRVENRIVINEGVDPELDKTKQLYANLPGILTGIAMEEAKRLQTPSCSIGYIPLIGYLTALPLGHPIESMPELEVIYETKDSVQVKSKKMTELDEQLGDVKLQIIDKETTIMLRMQKKVLSIAGLIRGAMRAAATLDAVISLAISAREFGWRCPELVDSSTIEAKSAEHPLARLIVKKIKKSFVVNPISSGGDFSKAKIFTGPNSCGKTVYMKMVGVIAFLAHIGSFVPAEGARIGHIDKIMTRLYTVDYVLEGMSTFAIDLNQVAMAIRRASGNSLVIIDEFGKGTMTEVGLSLLSSALSYWIEKGKSKCPHLLSSTHFHAIASHIPVDHSIASFHTFETRQVGGRMRFLYKLIDGVVDCSFAVHTAKEAGIEDSIIDRCTQVYTALKEGKSLTEIKLEESEQERNTNEILLHGMNEIM
ncbi:hypothetical protein WR25_24519 [Diploscapter pachys]|uniref:DNA mismatch repair proteins mutS family domain-containing protein n=1 Tax=Diploscapter pachys TaxID=2018661 RepID=A0A2A2L7X9_9BILA|nr:hypothetical protein WR25_24519 [Diploscapter pachys]